jgi:hypothetical protein
VAITSSISNNRESMKYLAYSSRGVECSDGCSVFLTNPRIVTPEFSRGSFCLSDLRRGFGLRFFLIVFMSTQDLSGRTFSNRAEDEPFVGISDVGAVGILKMTGLACC